ncbi:hypothetical protein N7491_008524 [Penicillium cf. griseofulvum]|uniref:Uncharacterized protein n=1 Tax=Penicillium cf. griseofulvum TaxID=2972120 RepID=A0A9W9MG46_9EURO|nr:hypothetical protein N7472_005874 [Penicillium cf. griseofulvum]KAJ5423308.1 hypothetical protein N7491_008524 [Penicillium cf. griseofulvum]KAJ5431418.1 hypothetical protein N7445_009150 [Penicillium cf. griseofulvum]
MIPTILSVFRRDCNGDETMSSCTKPTSSAVTIGIPAAISGVLLLIAIVVLIVLYHKRMRRDNREDLEDRQRDSGFYARYATQRFGNEGEGAPPSKGRPYAESRRSSGESIYDFKQDHGPYHLAQLPSHEVQMPKPVATRVVV